MLGLAAIKSRGGFHPAFLLPPGTGANAHSTNGAIDKWELRELLRHFGYTFVEMECFFAGSIVTFRINVLYCLSGASFGAGQTLSAPGL